MHFEAAWDTRDALLCEDEVWLEADDVFTDLLDVLLLHLQDAGKVLLTSDLNISLALSLLVLQGAVQQHNTGILDHSAHARVGHVLVYHHTSEHARVLDDPTGNLDKHINTEDEAELGLHRKTNIKKYTLTLTFSTLAYFLMSISLRPFSSISTVLTASRAMLQAMSDQRLRALVLMAELMIFSIISLSLTSTGVLGGGEESC